MLKSGKTVLTLGLVVALVGPATARAEAATVHAYGGHAFGSKVNLGSVIKSGETAARTMCTTRSGVTNTDNVAAMSIPELGRIGAVTTAISSHDSGGSPRSVSTATTAKTRLLAGAISASALQSRAVAERVDGHYKLTGSTTFTDLTILGQAAPADPAPEQTMSLPNIGSVLFNHQTVSHRNGSESITVTALTITIGDGNNLGLPTGKIVISRATANLHKPTHALPSGDAFGTYVNLGSRVVSGKTAPSYLPCGGSNGHVLTNNTAKVNTPALTAGVTTTSAQSTDSNRRTAAITIAKTLGVDLLGGVVSATAVRAHAKAYRVNGVLHRSSVNTKIVGLTVNGQTQDGSQPANTKFALPGVGTLWLHRVVRSSTGIKVYGLELDVTVAQQGVDAGTVIRVAGAIAAVRKS